MSVWTQEEHEKFLQALRLYPRGPWREVARHVGSRSARQVQTHAQKYNEKIARRERGLLKVRKRVVRPEHRVEQPSSIKRVSSAKPSRKSRNRSVSEASSESSSTPLSPQLPSQTSESPNADDVSELRSPMALAAHPMESEIEACLAMDHFAELHESGFEVEWLESAESDDASDRLDAAAVDTLTDSLLHSHSNLFDVALAYAGDVTTDVAWQDELLADTKMAATELDAGLLTTDAAKWFAFDYEADCDMERDAIMLSPLHGDASAFHDFDVAMSFGITS